MFDLTGTWWRPRNICQNDRFWSKNWPWATWWRVRVILPTNARFRFLPPCDLARTPFYALRTKVVTKAPLHWRFARITPSGQINCGPRCGRNKARMARRKRWKIKCWRKAKHWPTKVCSTRSMHVHEATPNSSHNIHCVSALPALAAFSAFSVFSVFLPCIPSLYSFSLHVFLPCIFSFLLSTCSDQKIFYAL